MRHEDPAGFERMLAVRQAMAPYTWDKCDFAFFLTHAGLRTPCSAHKKSSNSTVKMQLTLGCELRMLFVFESGMHEQCIHKWRSTLHTYMQLPMQAQGDPSDRSSA